MSVDFKDKETLRALTTTLLLKDFGLTVDIPQNHLIPTLPLRLNYLLWIEDLLNFHRNEDKRIIKGIDIGLEYIINFYILIPKFWSKLTLFYLIKI